MPSYLWPSEDGWPYPDAEGAELVADEAYDDDALVLRAAPPHLFDELSPLERQVVTAHYGLDGTPARTIKQLHCDFNLTRAEVREALVGGLTKLRSRLLVE